MIIYSPIDGQAFGYSVQNQPKHCFLMTRLGNPVPPMVDDIRAAVEASCSNFNYAVIDARARVTGRDFLLKIWQLIAATPLSVGVIHEDIPSATQANIFYEIGVAQGLGKETILIKSPKAITPSDFARTEYVSFDKHFTANFEAFINETLEVARFYETLADQLDRNPILAIDYLKRAYLINGESHLQQKVNNIVDEAGFRERASNSVELLAATL